MTTAPTEKTFVGTVGASGISWVEGPPLPGAVSDGCAGSIGNRIVHASGGNVLDLVGAKIIDLDAPTPAWSDALSSPAQERREPACFETQGALHVVGGGNKYSVSQYAVAERATIEPITGALSWSSEMSSSFAAQGSAAAIAAGRAWILGGFPCTKSVTSAPITGNDVGSWSASTDLSDFVYGATAAGDADRIYVVGGLAGPGCANGSKAVTMLRVDPSGAILSSSPQVAMPIELNYARAAVVNGRLYVLGGNVGGGNIAPTRDVISAGIAADGTLDSWRDEKGMPMPLARFALVVR